MGCSPSVLLTGMAQRSEGVPRGKDVVLRGKPDGLINFRVFFFKHSGSGSVFRLVRDVRNQGRAQSRTRVSSSRWRWIGQDLRGQRATKRSGTSGLETWRELCHCGGLSPTFMKCHGPERLAQSSLAVLIHDMHAVPGSRNPNTQGILPALKGVKISLGGKR